MEGKRRSYTIGLTALQVVEYLPSNEGFPNLMLLTNKVMIGVLSGLCHYFRLLLMGSSYVSH